MECQGRILFADDEEIVRITTSDFLRDRGYEVDCAEDGHSARQRLQETQYDLLISDIRMSGNADLALLRDLPELNAGLPIILITGYPSTPTAIQAIECSALAYLVKPFEFEDLLAQVQKGIRLGKLQQVAEQSSARSQLWVDQLSEIISSAKAAPGAFGRVPANHLLRIMLGHVAGSFMDLKYLADLASAELPEANGCPIQHCPRVEGLEELIREGVQTLERTRLTFKSKELGDLRLKLERAVSSSAVRAPLIRTT